MMPKVERANIMMTLQEIEIVNDYDGIEIVITDKDGKTHNFYLSKVEKGIIITEKEIGNDATV